MLATRLRFRLWPSWNRYLVSVILITSSMSDRKCPTMWTIIVFGTRLLVIYTPWELQEMPCHMPYPLGLGTRPQTVAQETKLPKLLKRWPVPVWSVRECCFPADVVCLEIHVTSWLCLGGCGIISSETKTT